MQTTFDFQILVLILLYTNTLILLPWKKDTDFIAYHIVCSQGRDYNFQKPIIT